MPCKISTVSEETYTRWVDKRRIRFLSRTMLFSPKQSERGELL